MDKKLLDILICPVCKGPIRYDKNKNELICKADALAFPIQDDVPRMIAGDARTLSAQELNSLK